MADDPRDKRRNPTPPSGVQRAIAQGARQTSAHGIIDDNSDPSVARVPTGEFDDESPSEVGRPPERRRATKQDITNMRGDLSKLGGSVADYMRTDTAEHKQIAATAASEAVSLRGEIGKFTGRFDDHAEKFDALAISTTSKFDVLTAAVGSVALESRETSVHVKHLYAAVKENQGAELRLRTEEEIAEIKDETNAKASWRSVRTKFLIALITLAGGAAALVIEHLIKKAYDL
jgi:hypothetical protein